MTKLESAVNDLFEEYSPVRILATVAKKIKEESSIAKDEYRHHDALRLHNLSEAVMNIVNEME